jgi:hypothetical protein
MLSPQAGQPFTSYSSLIDIFAPTRLPAHP